MAALIGSISAKSTNSNDVTTGALNTTGADFLVLVLSDYQAVSLSAISDSKGNTWNALTSHSVSSADRCTIFWSVPTSVGSGHTFTATRTGAFMSICVGAFSGMKPTTTFDQQNGNSGTATTLNTGSVTPSESFELLIAGIAIGSGNSTISSIDSGFTLQENQAFGGTGTPYGCGLAYLIQTTGAAKNPTWTTGGSGNIATAIATFRSNTTALTPGAATLTMTPATPGISPLRITPGPATLTISTAGFSGLPPAPVSPLLGGRNGGTYVSHPAITVTIT